MPVMSWLLQVQIPPLWDKQRANASYLTWLLQQEHTNHSERMLNVQTEGEAMPSFVPQWKQKIYSTWDGTACYRGRYAPLLQIQNTIDVSCRAQMSEKAEQLWPKCWNQKFFLTTHEKSTNCVCLILINPLAFCQNLMNFSLHRVNKRSQIKPHSLLETKHPDLVTYLSNTELHLPRVSFKISHYHWSAPCHDSYTFGLKDYKICQPLRQTSQPSMSNLITWVISQLEVAVNSKIKNKKTLDNSHLIFNLKYYWKRCAIKKQKQKKNMFHVQDEPGAVETVWRTLGVACGLYQLTYGEGVALQDMHLLTFNHVLLDSNLSNLERRRCPCFSYSSRRRTSGLG